MVRESEISLKATEGLQTKPQLASSYCVLSSDNYGQNAGYITVPVSLSEI